MTGLPMEEDEHAAASPAERRERFRAGLLHPDELPPDVRARFDAEAAGAVERHQAHAADSLARTAANIAAAEARHNAGRTAAEVASDSAPVTPTGANGYGGVDEDVTYVRPARPAVWDPDGLGVPSDRRFRPLPTGALPAAQLAVSRVADAAVLAGVPPRAPVSVRHVDLYRTVLNAIPHGPGCGSETSVGIDCACDLASQEADADAVTRAVEVFLRGVGIGVDQRGGAAWDATPTRSPAACGCGHIRSAHGGDDGDPACYAAVSEPSVTPSGSYVARCCPCEGYQRSMDAPREVRDGDPDGL